MGMTFPSLDSQVRKSYQLSQFRDIHIPVFLKDLVRLELKLQGENKFI